ncbi:hypothetical protein ERO13_1Z049427v2, partial [Gossypium hirsutum]
TITVFLPPFMFGLLFATFGVILSAKYSSITVDQSAFLALKSHITHDPYNFLTTNWSTSTSVCSWIGVTCGSRHHRVTALNLSSMDLTGTISSQLGNLSFLAWLDIHQNSFHGSLPIELTNLRRMKYLDFGNNSFNGEIPSWFGCFSKLQRLSLYLNNFIGVIPSTLGNLSKLEGEIPLVIGNLTSLQMLSLQSNKLTGRIPTPPPLLQWYAVSTNNLIGEIPSSVCNLTSLKVMALDENNLEGTIPKCIGNMSSSLTAVDLGNNNFHGQIPENFAKGCMLRSLGINNNELEGSLPRSLGNCKGLNLLNVGNNNLNDTFPSWLGNLDQLQVLILRSNRFYGQIESFDITVSLTKLRIIDLSHNNFNEYGKNVEPNYMREVKPTKDAFGVFWVDYASGENSKILGELHLLLVLNLSHNCLIGPIPSSLGNLSELESLDLSSNKLEGRIPTELKNLGFLEVLNLSQNNLKGPIPQGKQFDTFTKDSYMGNSDLCAKFDRDDDGDELNWKFSILMGYGCGLVLGMSMAYIVFTTGKPWWLIRIVERVRQRFAKR